MERMSGSEKAHIMTEHERDTEFLKHCLGYGDSAEGHKLQERVTRIQQDERLVRRALWWMALSTLLAFAGVCYSTFFWSDLQNLSYITAHLLTKVFCVVGLGSFICMLAFCVMVKVYHHELNQRRADCRRLALELLQSLTGKTLQAAIIPARPAHLSIELAFPTGRVVKVAPESS